MDTLYHRRLEAIDWKSLYEGAFGYQLIERLKTDISKISPGYDYVLIDSLTGYSDVGGICVKQLPDALVLLFRLNQQNIDGIGSVYQSLAKAGPSKGMPVLPVITPSWPFLDETALGWIEKAQSVFPSEKLLEISFDSSLSFGERIISESASKLALTSKILVDYRNLASQLRKRNSADPLTIWTAISNRRELSEDSGNLFLTLLQQRPNNPTYWRNMPTAFQPWLLRPEGKQQLPSTLEALVTFTRQEANKGNKFALLALSTITAFLSSEAKDAQRKQLLDKAIQLDPKFADARIHRGRLALFQNRYSNAIADLSTCLDLPPADQEVSADAIQAMIAGAYLSLFQPEAALAHINSAIVLNPSNIEYCLIRAKALYLKGDYADALASAQMFARTYRSHHIGSLLPVLILAAMGRTAEASSEIRRIARSERSRQVWDIAEAYLALDPARTIKLLSGREQERPTVYRLLTLLAGIFLGEDTTLISIAAKDHSHGVKVDPTWNVFEVVAILRAKERAGVLGREAVELAYTAIRGFVDRRTASIIGRVQSESIGSGSKELGTSS
jgi:tetratricopeptide (TPR) repeat protein